MLASSEHHPDLTPADLEAAWAYYATHREEIDQVIKEAIDASPMVALYVDKDFSYFCYSHMLLCAEGVLLL